MICLWKIGIFSKSVHGVFSSLSAMIRWHANSFASVRHQPFLIPVSPTAGRHSRRSAGTPLVYCRAPLIFRAVSVSGRGNGVFDDDDCDDHQYSVFVHLFRERQSPQIILTYTPPRSKLALYPNLYQRNLVYIHFPENCKHLSCRFRPYKHPCCSTVTRDSIWSAFGDKTGQDRSPAAMPRIFFKEEKGFLHCFQDRVMTPIDAISSNEAGSKF